MGHDDDLLAIFPLMRGDNRAAGDVLPVFAIIVVGVNVSGIKTANIALICVNC